MKFLLIVIMVLAISSRLFDLAALPVGLTEVEAGIGFNAASLLSTTKNEWGENFALQQPIINQYISVITILVTAISVSIFGLTEFGVRLPAAILGIISVYLFYQLGLRVFKDQKIALLQALLLAICPWIIQLNRFDTQFSLTLFILIIYFIIWFSQLKNKLWWLVLIQSIGIVISPSILLIVPLTIYLTLTQKSNLNQKYRKLFLVLAGLVILIVLNYQAINDYFLAEAFYLDIGYLNHINDLRGLTTSNGIGILGKLIENKFVIFGDYLFKNYLASFDFYYLYSQTDFLQPHLMNVLSKLYPLELIFFLLGVYFVIKEKFENGKILLWVLLLIPLLTIFKKTNPVNLVNPLMVLPYFGLVAYGFINLVKTLSNQIIKKSLIVIVGILLFWNVAIYSEYYFNHFSQHDSNHPKLIYQSLSSLAKDSSNQYDEIILTDKISQTPYLYYLFYNQINPREYQKIAKETVGGEFKQATLIGNIRFRSVNQNTDQLVTNKLFMGHKLEMVNFANICLDPINKCQQSKSQLIDNLSNVEIEIIGNQKI